MPIPEDDASATTTTLAQWVDRVRDHVEGPKTGPVNILADDHVADGTTLTFTYDLAGIAAGSVLSLGAATFLVVATDEGAKTATVVPGWQSSDDGDAETGSVVRVNPAFTDHRIIQELNDALASLSSPGNGLFQVITEDLAYVSGTTGYDFDAPALLHVLEVRRQTADSSLAWPRLRAGAWSIIEDADVDDFPSGRGIRIAGAESGYGVRVTYAAGFDPLSGLGTLVSTSGISATAEDIPPLTAAIGLMSGREIGRNTLSSQGDTRRPSEVPPGAIGRSYGGLVGKEQRRIREEVARLRARFRFTR